MWRSRWGIVSIEFVAENSGLIVELLIPEEVRVACVVEWAAIAVKQPRKLRRMEVRSVDRRSLGVHDWRSLFMVL